MDLSDTLQQLKPAAMSAEEWQMRLELAACYRVVDHMGWSEMTANHITVRVPGPAKQYLINPFGLLYSEVTASNLVKIDIAGNIVGESAWPVNAAGFVIHSAIHGARDDAHFVMHTHTTAGMAVACKDEGLRHDNFYSAYFYDRVAYHEFEGVTTHAGEQPRLVASLGDKDVLILRNHGLLVIGDHVPDGMYTMWALQRACEVQLAADSLRGANRAIGREVLEAIPEQVKPLQAKQGRIGQRMFDAMMRKAGIRYEDVV